MTPTNLFPRVRIGDLILASATGRFTGIGVVVEYERRSEHFNATFVYRNSLQLMSVLKLDRVIAR